MTNSGDASGREMGERNRQDAKIAKVKELKTGGRAWVL